MEDTREPAHATGTQKLAARAAPTGRRLSASKRRSRRAQILTAIFTLIMLVAVGAYAREVEWGKVGHAIRNFHTGTLLAASALAVASCLLYGVFEIISQTQTSARLPWPWLAAVAFTSYTFNLNLGPWIGSLGMRLKLYTQLGLKGRQVAGLVGFTTLTNWLGYTALAGTAFTFYPDAALPESLAHRAWALRLAGVGLLACTFAYWGWSAFARKRVYHLRGLRLQLPKGDLAVAQTLVAALNWILIALVPWVLMKGAVPLSTALCALLLACAVGAAAHIPAGLGVIDAVLITLLGRDIPRNEMVASILVYRAVYYLLPFILGVMTYAVLETLLRRKPALAWNSRSSP